MKKVWVKADSKDKEKVLTDHLLRQEAIRYVPEERH